MKRIIFIFVVCLVFGCKEKEEGINSSILNNPASLREEDKDLELPEITFENPTVDFGSIIQGDKVQHSFTFTNTGDAPLAILDVSGSCGCTVFQDYPKDPIKPGKSGTLNLEYDSEGKWGEQTVTVSVVSNTRPATSLLNIKVNVIAPEQ